MDDRERLQQMIEAIDQFHPSSVALGGLVRRLEQQFELITTATPKVDRAFRDFWNAGEVVWVAAKEEHKEISQQNWDDITKLFLPALRAAIKEQLNEEA